MSFWVGFIIIKVKQKRERSVYDHVDCRWEGLTLKVHKATPSKVTHLHTQRSLLYSGTVHLLVGGYGGRGSSGRGGGGGGGGGCSSSGCSSSCGSSCSGSRGFLSWRTIMSGEQLLMLLLWHCKRFSTETKSDMVTISGRSWSAHLNISARSKGLITVNQPACG